MITDRVIRLSAALALAGATLPAQAGQWSAGLAGSTLGFGAEGGYSFNEQFSVRVAGYAFSLDEDGEESGINYDADLDLSNLGVYVDWHVFGGAFRVTGGWFATDNELDAQGKPGPGDTYDIGGSTFTVDEVGTLRARADLGNSAPYLGFGWRWALPVAGLAWSLDVGALFQDSPDVTMTSTGGTLSGEPALQDAIAAEEADLENEVDDFEIYPVLSLGVSYRF